jgi:hypothetical protein
LILDVDVEWFGSAPSDNVAVDWVNVADIPGKKHKYSLASIYLNTLKYIVLKENMLKMPDFE